MCVRNVCHAAKGQSNEQRLRTTERNGEGIVECTLYQDDHEHSPDAQEYGTEWGHS